MRLQGATGVASITPPSEMLETAPTGELQTAADPEADLSDAKPKPVVLTLPWTRAPDKDRLTPVMLALLASNVNAECVRLLLEECHEAAQDKDQGKGRCGLGAHTCLNR